MVSLLKRHRSNFWFDFNQDILDLAAMTPTQLLRGRK